MLQILLKRWNSSSFSQKIAIIKQVAIQLGLLCVIAFAFFWSMFFFTWFLTMLIGVQPYFQYHSPNFHVRPLMPNSLITIYINHNIRAEACQLGQDHLFFSELTMPYNEYCNIEQNELPRMRDPVDIALDQVDPSTISYITGCIKHRTRAVSCQKYPATYHTQLFRNLQFHQLYYMQVELHLKSPQNPPSSFPRVQFEEKCWMITKLFKKYYSVIAMTTSVGITVLLTIAALIFRLVQIARNINASSANNIYEQFKYATKKSSQNQSKIKNLQKENKQNTVLFNKSTNSSMISAPVSSSLKAPTNVQIRKSKLSQKHSEVSMIKKNS